MSFLTQPKGGSTNTTTQVNQVSQYAQDAQANLLNASKIVTNGVLANQPNYTQAGFNSDQTGAYDLTRYLAQGAFSNPVPQVSTSGYAPTGYDASPYTSRSYAPTSYQATGMGTGQGYSAAQTSGPATYDATTAGSTAQTYDPSLATAAQTGPTDYRPFMNPYMQDVIDPAVQQVRRSHDETSANIAAQAAAAGMFGGSGAAIQQAQNDRALGDQTSSLVGNLMSQGYTAAQAIAQANTQLQQQAGLTNAAAQNAAGQFNATAGNNLALANANILNQAGQFNAAARNTDAQYNTTARNQAGQFNASAADAARQFDAAALNAAAAANTGYANTASQFGANSANTAAAANAAAENAAKQFSAGAYNTAGQYNAGLALQAQQLQDALYSSDQTRKSAAIQALLGIGNAQQSTLQNYLNQPLAYLQALGAITPQNYGGTTVGTAPNTAQSPLQSLLGVGTTLGAAALK